MKALSFSQPWASLVASGQKRYETRSWSTSYRGPLLIHAAKGVPPYARDFAADYGLSTEPRGALIAVVDLVGVYSTRSVVVDEIERLYGDYGPGRFAWRLENVRLLAEPVPFRGSLGLFEVADSARRERLYR